MGFRIRVSNLLNRSRRGVSGSSIAVLMVSMAVAFYVGIAILPGALAGWYAATQAGGSLENMSDDFITLWNLAPIMVVLAIIVCVVGIALYHLKSVG
jgi:ABC-type microcin C transport system permease subunit YejE